MDKSEGAGEAMGGEKDRLLDQLKNDGEMHRLADRGIDAPGGRRLHA